MKKLVLVSLFTVLTGCILSTAVSRTFPPEPDQPCSVSTTFQYPKEVSPGQCGLAYRVDVKLGTLTVNGTRHKLYEVDDIVCRVEGWDHHGMAVGMWGTAIGDGLTIPREYEAVFARLCPNEFYAITAMVRFKKLAIAGVDTSAYPEIVCMQQTAGYISGAGAFPADAEFMQLDGLLSMALTSPAVGEIRAGWSLVGNNPRRYSGAYVAGAEGQCLMAVYDSFGLRDFRRWPYASPQMGFVEGAPQVGSITGLESGLYQVFAWEWRADYLLNPADDTNLIRPGPFLSVPSGGQWFYLGD